MPRWMAAVYDRIMEPTEQACLAEWRSELVGEAKGRVLEVGAGTGANVTHYTDAVESVTFTEPDPYMLELLEARLKEQPRDWDYRVLEVPVEELPFADDEFDTVVSTLVLCSVADPELATRELRRVLKPGGELLFLEHVAADHGSRRYLWQRIVEPVWKRVAGNCHTTRRTGEHLEAAGFDLDEVESESMRKAVSFVRPTIRGVAR